MSQMKWQPTAEQANSTLLSDYMAFIAQEGYAGITGPFSDYDSLHDWSVAELDGFWSSVWDFADIIGEKGTTAYRHDDDIQKAGFFPDARLNYAENMLRYQGGEDAIIQVTEDGTRTSWSHDDLRNQVSRLQQALQSVGVTKGDRVAGLVPNSKQAIAFMLAAASLGAIWSSCSPDFGFSAAMDRLAQIEPKILVSADGYSYNGKSFSSAPLAAELKAAMPCVSHLVLFEFAGGIALPEGENILWWDDFIAPYQPAELVFAPMDFTDPLYIMFSSGTTGLPKCIVHSVGGVTLKHKQELLLQGDMQEGDRLFYFTTCGWMMWNWSISALMCGASLVLFDGSPFYPAPDRFVALIEQESITHFGTSAKYIDACAKADLVPKDHFQLAHLRMIFSTGSPLSAEGFDYIYRDWKADLCLASIAGGTDIIGCFVGGAPIAPIWRGQCQKRLLGMDVAVYGDDGKQVATGEKGELVCLKAHPSMPVKFWKDDDGSRYHKAYFARFANVWHHGDCVSLTEEGGMIFHGRSDATLNPGGVRIGTAEIYRQVEALDEILESVVIGQDYDHDQRVVLFVKLRDGHVLDDALITRIKTRLRTNATPRHVPAIILSVADIPRTKSGKITELAVRDIVHGKQINNVGALANPEALDHFRDLPELS
ncbi:MAG: acetoacetate--CoA ligase [Candidatus Puniceispirillaceae bacterium]